MWADRVVVHRRIATSEIEGVIIRALTRLLHAPTEVMEAVAAPTIDTAASRSVIAAASGLAKELEASDHAKAHDLMRRLVTCVTVRERSIGLRLNRSTLRDLLGIATEGVEADSDDVELSIPAQLRPRGGELKFVIADPAHRLETKADPVLVKALIKANDWLDSLLTGDSLTIERIAQAAGVTNRYVRRIIELAFLAPDIQQMILDGRQPADMSTEWLVRGADLPLDWCKQRQVLGFPT
jgi:hypothetical protein